MSDRRMIRTFKLRWQKKAQATLEIAAAFACILILIFGTMQIFLWANKSFISRQQLYQKDRKDAANSPVEMQVNETDIPDLNIFNN